VTEKKHTEVWAGEGYVSRGTDPLAAVRYRLRVIDTLQDQQGGWNPIHTEAIRTSRRIEGAALWSVAIKPGLPKSSPSVCTLQMAVVVL